MVVKTWVAAHTGLPSFYSDQPIRISSQDGRVLSDGTSRTVMVSDVLAAPGAPTHYRVGTQQVTLTRALGAPGHAVLTRRDGRPLPGLFLADNQDPIDWKSDVTVFPSGAVRWPTQSSPCEGTSVLILDDPAEEDRVWDMLTSAGVLVIGPAQPLPGVPVRAVAIEQVSRKRTRKPRIHLEAKWTQLPAGALAGWKAPVVTWGEWAALGKGWQARSALQVAQAIAGMPL